MVDKLGVVLLGGEQDTDRAGTAGTNQIEKVIADNNRLIGSDVHRTAGMQDGKGIGLGGPVFARNDTIESETVDTADTIDTVPTVAGDDAHLIIAPAQVVEQVAGAGVESGIRGSGEFVAVQNLKGPLAAVGFHMLH